MGLVIQRIDIFSNMLYKRKLNKLTCSLFANDHQPRLMDTIDYYELCLSKNLQNNKWKTLIHNGYYCEYEEICFELTKPVYGYVIHRGNILIWSEKFGNEPFVPNEEKKKLNLKLTAKITF